MFDLGIKVRKENDNYVIDDVQIVYINEESLTAEFVFGDKKEIYPIMFTDDDAEEFVLPQQETIINSLVCEEDSITDKIDHIREMLVGKPIQFDIQKLKESETLIGEIDLKLLSKEIKESIIGQDKVVDKVISTIFHNQDLYESDLDDDEAMQGRQTMLIYGGTGTGKTEIVKQVAERTNIPYCIEDATKFTDEAYKARNVSEMLVDLLRAADDDIDLAERGILIIDEIDKKRTSGDESVSTTAVQNSLLKILDGSTIQIEYGNETIDFDTSFLTIIMCGAFEGLRKKKKKNAIGFNVVNENTNERFTTDDFINYGMTHELMGRITSIAKTDDFDYDSLKKILLCSKISPLNLKKKYLELHDIEFNFDEEFLDKIVKDALEKKTGARGLKSAVSDVFDNLDFNLDFDILTEEIKEIKFEKGKVRKIGKKSSEKRKNR